MPGAPTRTTERRDRKSCKESSGFAASALLVSLVTAAVVVTPAPAQAQVAPVDDSTVDDSAPAPHVRPEAELRALVDDATRGAPSIRGLIDRLEALDVTVYIRVRAFAQPDLEGRVALLSVVGEHRYLVIELACPRTRLAQMATLGHELYHAVEIANEPSIVDARTLAAFYTRIGRRTDDWSGRQMFETDAAADAGVRARRELVINSTRRANGT